MDRLPTVEDFRSVAAEEAIARLKLLKPEAISTIVSMLEATPHDHPRSVCSIYRGKGLQLSDSEKATARIRKNAHMSYQAFNEIDNAGRESPITAHELTLLRASFSVSRHRTAISALKVMKEIPRLPFTLTFDVFHQDSCDVCKSLHGHPVPADWGILPVASCTCQTAPYGLNFHADFVGGLIAEEEAAKDAPASFLGRLQSIFQVGRR